MKNFPVFPCADGVASLTLCEIPYKGVAYVNLRTVYGSAENLLKDCLDFCRAAGATEVFASGEMDFSGYAPYATLCRRAVQQEMLPATTARAEKTDNPEWVALYNQAFRAVPAAATFQTTPEGACFVFDGAQRIGLGMIAGREIAAVASFCRGRGADCLCALASAMGPGEIEVLCARENLPAWRLYDRLGFCQDAPKRIWYHTK